MEEKTWESLLEEMMKYEKELDELIKILEKGQVTFQNKRLKQEAFIHKSSKNNRIMQFSYFDKEGAVGDFEASSINEMAEKILQYGFTPCSAQDFNYSLLAYENKKDEN